MFKFDVSLDFFIFLSIFLDFLRSLEISLDLIHLRLAQLVGGVEARVMPGSMFRYISPDFSRFLKASLDFSGFPKSPLDFSRFDPLEACPVRRGGGVGARVMPGSMFR